MGIGNRDGSRRRQFIARAAGAAGGIFLGCCGDAAPPSKKTIMLAALVSVKIGERIVHLSHPALRILGMVLIVGGTATKLEVTYIDLDQTERKEEVKLDQQEAQKLDSTKKVGFVRQDGKLEEFDIKETKSENS